MALRWFIGGCKYDISANHDVEADQVHKSVCLIVDAINYAKVDDIKFPTSREVQQEMADLFATKLVRGFTNCVRFIDGMLLWTFKPTENTDNISIGPSKFFNGRKMKFGLNMQAVCDSNKKLLDVTCSHPGSASDFTIWLDCDLRKKVEKFGFLKTGLILYVDYASVNTMQMVTQFKQVSQGPKDAYNFFQSQLRIKWGCSRKPLLQT